MHRHNTYIHTGTGVGRGESRPIVVHEKPSMSES
jgi:hypothetical protein